MKKLCVQWWWGVMVCLMAGCCTTYPGAAYIEADEATYEYAQPKLEEWAEAKGGDWPAIVENKGISWKARITKGKTLPKTEEKTP